MESSVSKQPKLNYSASVSDSKSSNNNNNNNTEKRMPLSRSLTQPQGTIEYVVEPSDTIASVAARHQTTPSELARINKIIGRFIFPGQVLYVPKRTTTATEGKDVGPPPNTPNDVSRLKSNTTTDGGGGAIATAQAGGGNRQQPSADGSTSDAAESPLPGQAQRILDNVPMPSSEGDLQHIQIYQTSSAPITADRFATGTSQPQSSSSAEAGAASDDQPRAHSSNIDPADRECLERFLKINVRHITDGQGVVGGVLLVTPNALMFDPNVSDPLVIEHGTELYGVTVPTELVLKTALYSDIAHMRTKHAPEAVPSVPKPSVYYANDSDTSGIVEENLKSNVYSSKGEGGRETTTSTDETTQESIKDKDGEDEQQQQQQPNKSAEKETPPPPPPAVTQKPTGKLARPLISFDDEQARDADEVDFEPRVVPQSREKPKEDEQAEAKDEKKEPNKDDDEEKENVVKQDEEPKPEKKKPEPICLNKKQESQGSSLGDSEDSPRSVSTKSPNTLSSHFQAKLALSERHSAPMVPSGNAEANKVVPLVSAVSADESVDENSANVRRSAHGESRREQMMKRFSNPVDTIGSLTKSGINSSISATKSGFSATKSGLSSGLNATKTGISTGLGITKTGINAGISVTKTGFNRVLSTPKNLMDFSSGLVRDAKGALGSKSDNDLADLANELDEGRLQRKPSKKSGQPTGERMGYTNMVDTKIDAFENFDKLIPRPARMSKDTPLYLCIRIGKHKKGLPNAAAALGPRFSPTYSFGKKKYEREYWFSVPKDKAHNLFHFFKKWSPEIYGDVDDISGCEQRGLEPLTTDDEDEEVAAVMAAAAAPGEAAAVEKPEARRRSSEVGGDKSETDTSKELSAAKPKFWRRRSPLNFLKLMEDTFSTEGMSTEWNVSNSSDDHSFVERFRMDTDEPILPDLIGTTELLTEDMIRNLAKHLPARAEGYAWTLIYSTSMHGFSLNSLYREMKNYDTPTLLMIEDTNGAKFGALLSTILQMSDHFYGTGETFLFTFYPEFACFPWTGENLFFIKGNSESISLGAGEGCFGLWLDGDLYHGSSHPCKTFGNTTLSSEEDFVVKSIECWGFV